MHYSGRTSSSLLAVKVKRSPRFEIPLATATGARRRKISGGRLQVLNRLRWPDVSHLRRPSPIGGGNYKPEGCNNTTGHVCRGDTEGQAVGW